MELKHCSFGPKICSLLWGLHFCTKLLKSLINQLFLWDHHSDLTLQICCSNSEKLQNSKGITHTQTHQAANVIWFFESQNSSQVFVSFHQIHCTPFPPRQAVAGAPLSEWSQVCVFFWANVDFVPGDLIAAMSFGQERKLQQKFPVNGMKFREQKTFRIKGIPLNKINKSLTTYESLTHILLALHKYFTRKRLRSSQS